MNQKLVLSPHNDDETLFAGYICQREKPRVAIVYDSFVQVSRGAASCSASARRAESSRALKVLGVDEVRFCGVPDDQVNEQLVDLAVRGLMADAAEIWAPLPDSIGHEQHNAVGMAARRALQAGQVLRYYSTYQRIRGKLYFAGPVLDTMLYGIVLEKVGTSGRNWTRNKLIAMTCYESQLDLENCRPHFERDLYEYEAIAADLRTPK